MKHPLFLALPAVAALLVACGGGDSDTSVTGGTPNVGQNGAADISTVLLEDGLSCDTPQFPQKLLAAVNNVRAQPRNCGGQEFGPTAALGWNDLLTSAAADHSSDMATQIYYSSVGLDGRSYHERIADTGYKSQYTGEVLALISGSLTSDNIIPRAIEGWMKDSANCAAVKSSVFDEIGGACVKVGKKAYLTMTLGGS